MPKHVGNFLYVLRVLYYSVHLLENILIIGTCGV